MCAWQLLDDNGAVARFHREMAECAADGEQATEVIHVEVMCNTD
jgi:hypothetical protein